MIYDKNKYSFLKPSNIKDEAPSWMDDFFKNLNKPEDTVKLAGVFKTEKKKHHCSCCGNHLNDNEVTFCKKCIQESLY